MMVLIVTNGCYFFLGSRASTPLSVSLPGSDSDHSVSGDDLDGSTNMVSSDDEFEFSDTNDTASSEFYILEFRVYI